MCMIFGITMQLMEKRRLFFPPKISIILKAAPSAHIILKVFPLVNGTINIILQSLLIAPPPSQKKSLAIASGKREDTTPKTSAAVGMRYTRLRSGQGGVSAPSEERPVKS